MSTDTVIAQISHDAEAALCNRLAEAITEALGCEQNQIARQHIAKSLREMAAEGKPTEEGDWKSLSDLLAVVFVEARYNAERAAIARLTALLTAPQP